MIRGIGIVAVLAVLATARLAGAAGSPDLSIGNFVANPDAESGQPAPWTDTGWQVRDYAAVPEHDPNNHPGARGFAADAPGGTLVQTVSVEKIAARIDAGEDLGLVLDLYLGGAGNGGASAAVQPLDADGQALGNATTVGPPGAADYYGKPALVECFRSVTLPPGTRSARVTLTAAGPGPALADNVWFGGPFARTLIGRIPPQEPASAANCWRFSPSVPAPTPTATPSPTPHPLIHSASGLILRHRSLSFVPATRAATTFRVARRGVVIRHGRVRGIPGRRVVRRLRRLPGGRYRITIAATSPYAIPTAWTRRLR